MELSNLARFVSPGIQTPSEPLPQWSRRLGSFNNPLTPLRPRLRMGRSTLAANRQRMVCEIANPDGHVRFECRLN